MMAMILMIFFFSLACRLTSSWVPGTRCSVKRWNVQFGSKETIGQVTHLWKQNNHRLWMKWNRQQIIDISQKVFHCQPHESSESSALGGSWESKIVPPILSAAFRYWGKPFQHDDNGDDCLWVLPLGIEDSLVTMMIMVMIVSERGL